MQLFRATFLQNKLFFCATKLTLTLLITFRFCRRPWHSL